jgi:large subunit ribosomal protein L23
MEIYRILERPVITEKSTAQANPTPSRRRGSNPSARYTFRVSRDANKIQIREAVEKRFNVNVVDVNTATVRARARGMGKRRGEVPGWKKAFVTLKPGQSIDDFFGSV